MIQETNMLAELFAYAPSVVEVASGLFIIIGGIWGLRLAKRRLDTFEEQVQTSQDQVEIRQWQLFNDTMGRGVELLNNENIAIRDAGIQLLSNLANVSHGERAELIIKLLHQYTLQRNQRP